MAFRMPGRSGNFGSDDAANSEKVLKKGKNFLVVAAIDFGTTYSGYAYSWTSDYHKDHTQVYTNRNWTAGGDLLSLKAPTTVLFDKDGHLHSFGFQAETKYAQLAEEEEHGGWQYFSRFKMELFGSTKITKNTMLKDDQGKTKLALEVFSATITFLRDHLMETLKQRIHNIVPKDVMWVLTVPAIWDDEAKQFMEEAATMAGIPQTQFVLALEPECAAIYCKEIHVQKAQETKQTAYMKTFEKGAQFMVVDLGGGTVDITAHEVSSDGSLKELTPPSGGPWGGMVVDAAYFKFLRQLFTDKVMDEFGTGSSSKSDYLDLVRLFEGKKRAINDCHGDGDSVMINIPSFLFEVFRAVQGTDFETSLEHNDFGQTVKKRRGRDKVFCDAKIFINLFEESKRQIIAHLRNLLAKPELRRVTTLMLVGGFSESGIIHEALKKEFKDMRVILPNDAGLAVVKGAVMYGFNEASIRSRVMPFTYGIATVVPYDDSVHRYSKRVVRYGYAKCEDIFKVFVTKGTEVVADRTFVENTFNFPYVGASAINIDIYKSDHKQPMYIDDFGSRKVGELKLQLQTSNQDETQMIIVKMVFGKTQLEVQAREHGTCDDRTVKAKFDFLG